MPMRTSQPWRTNRARVLRANATSAEALLWSKLRNRQLGNCKFVRQHPIGSYFIFACRDAMLVVEIDGETHSTADEIERDAIRDVVMQHAGYRVVRVSNRDVYDSLEGGTLLRFYANNGAWFPLAAVRTDAQHYGCNGDRRRVARILQH